jgi:putative transcriptional regulator
MPRTEAQIEAGALSDPDNPPLTKEQLKNVRRVPPPDAKAIRKATGMSQADFAWTYGFDVSALRDWEQRRRTPDRAAQVLLMVIQYEPESVQRALAAYALQGFRNPKSTSSRGSWLVESAMGGEGTHLVSVTRKRPQNRKV